MTQNDGHLHDLEDMDDDFFKMQIKKDNLTLVHDLTEQEKKSGIVSEARRPLVDRLKGKSRRVRRQILKGEYKKQKENKK